jgi:hypothetical protein
MQTRSPFARRMMRNKTIRGGALSVFIQRIIAMNWTKYAEGDNLEAWLLTTSNFCAVRG